MSVLKYDEYYRGGVLPSPNLKELPGNNLNNYDKAYNNATGFGKTLYGLGANQFKSQVKDHDSDFKNVLADSFTFTTRMGGLGGLATATGFINEDLDYNTDFFDIADNVGVGLVKGLGVSAGSALGGPLGAAGAALLQKGGENVTEKFITGSDKTPYSLDEGISDAVGVGTSALMSSFSLDSIGNAGKDVAKEGANVAVKEGANIALKENVGIGSEVGKKNLMDKVFSETSNQATKNIVDQASTDVATDVAADVATETVKPGNMSNFNNVLGKSADFLKKPENVANVLNTAATGYQIARGVKAVKDAEKMEANRISPGKRSKWEDVEGFNEEAEASFKAGVDKAVATRRRYDEVMGRDSGNQTMAETIEAERKFAADKNRSMLEAESLNKQGRLQTEMSNRQMEYDANLKNAQIERKNALLKAQRKSQAKNAIAQSLTGLGQSYINSAIRKEGEIDRINYMLSNINPSESPQKAILYNELYNKKQNLE